jgi:hypothetical protein
LKPPLPALKFTVLAGLAAGLALSPRLWLSGRRYPLVPVLGSLPTIQPPADGVIYAAILILTLLAAVFVRSRKVLAALIAVAALYALFDESRWQPWFYQYLLMLAAFLDPRPGRALGTCRWIVACVYFWSGLHKVNAGFIHQTFPFLVETLPGGPWLRPLAYAAPVLEAAMGAGLLTARFRSIAAVSAISMHLLILAGIGPLGQGFDSVVWPWNLAMICLVWFLLRSEGDWRPVPGWAILLCGVAPALHFFNLWDGYLSFSLYSGNSNYAVIYMADAVADRLPEALQQQIDTNPSQVDELDLMAWSYAELNVPAYSELRVYRSVARRVCLLAGNPERMVLCVDRRATLFGRHSRSFYTCADLARE